MSSGIVITGLGPVTALGAGKSAVWENLKKAQPAVSTVQQMVGGEEWESYPLAAVKDSELAENGFTAQALAGRPLPDTSRDLYLFAAAASIALADSGLKFDSSDNRVGLVISHENPGFDAYTRQIWGALEKLSQVQNKDRENGNLLKQVQAIYSEVENAGYNTHSFVLLQQLTVFLQTHGPALAVNNACSSGLYALETAANWLRAGHADAMLVVCGDSPRLIPRYLWLKTARTCSADSVIRPFDKNRNGFILGEGAGAVVIETLESARRRGVHIYTKYLSGAFRSDAWKLSLPAVSPHLYCEALSEALRTAEKSPSEIDLVVPHGAATAIQDRYEADGITRIFGRKPQRPFVTALKPYIGHTLAGCSLLELILALIGISHQTVLPTLNWTTEDDKLGILPVQKPTPYEVNTWIKTATGFGGFNAACVFEQAGACA